MKAKLRYRGLWPGVLLFVSFDDVEGKVGADDSFTYPRYTGFSSYCIPHFGEFITQG